MSAEISIGEPPLLRVEGLAKSFFGVHVLHDVAFDLRGGDVLGLVGENGSGKSTALNILAGVLARDRGRILLDGNPYQPGSRADSAAAGVAFVQQELNIFPNLTVAENLFLGRFPRMCRGLPLVSRSAMRTQSFELLRAVDLAVEPDELVHRLPPGERQLLEIARGLGADTRLLLLDEPTTSLTPREITRLFEIIGRLKARGVAVVFVSHALDDVLRIADHLVVMRDGRITLRAPNRGITAGQLVVAMVGRSVETLFPVRRLSSSSGPAALEVEHVGEPGVVNDVTFRLAGSETLGIFGLMGAGRSELARILFGLDPHRVGSVRAGNRVLRSGDLAARLSAGIAFVTEDRRQDSLMMDASVADNLGLATLPLYSVGVTRRVASKQLADASRTLADRLNLRGGGMTTLVRALSGGNQQKTVLGRWLLRTPAIFILDEPTRGVDVGAKEEIYRLLAEMADNGAANLVISSEIEELVGLCDRILVMHRGRITSEFNCRPFDREAILKAAFGQ